MKYLKMLGLAAVAAMALMAFLGASSASATVLCKTAQTENCHSSGWAYPKGTVINASLKPGTKAVLRDTSGFLQDECGLSTVEGSTSNTGSSTETISGSVEAKKLTFGECSAEATNVLKGGTLEVHWIPGTDNGTVTASGFEVTVKNGLSCVFKAGAGIDLGTLTGSATAPILNINTVVEGGGGFGCPATGIWKGEYVVTSPVPLFVSTS